MAIETRYSSVQFRSRLEAKWAAFFDLLNWPWEYEPFDLDGYIPDFVLRFRRPLLVEVKPIITEQWQEVAAEAHGALDKIERSGWQHEALLVGATVWDDPGGYGGSVIGLLGEKCGRGLVYDAAELNECDLANRGSLIGLYHRSLNWTCRAHHHDGRRSGAAWPPRPGFASETFREAGNRVQWKPR